MRYCPMCGTSKAIIDETFRCGNCGKVTKITQVPESTINTIRMKISTSNKISAIKDVREYTGWSLRNSKYFVDLIDYADKGEQVDFRIEQPPTKEEIDEENKSAIYARKAYRTEELLRRLLDQQSTRNFSTINMSDFIDELTKVYEIKYFHMS
jgi:hypothetical protein